MKRRFRRCLGASLLLLSATPPAVSVEPDDRENSAQAPSRPADMPLSLLPEPPPLELPAPRPASLEAIDAILARIVSAEPAVREHAVGELLEVRPDWAAGLSRRLDRLAERADRPAMRSLLERLRSRNKKQGSSDDNDEGGGDYLELALGSPDPASAVWRDLVQLLSISHMLRNVGSADAVREIIRVYVRFGEFTRVHVQRELALLGDRQVAGLLEAERHQAPKIASWARKRLDLLGKAIAHEAVRTKDQAALADILVALGRSRDPDAGRVLVSFASTEKSQVRTAARQGLALLGEVGAWQLRDAYQDTTGKQAPRDWTWKRTARELFTEFDRLRSSKVFELYEVARQAEGKGDLDAMSHGYDQVLALSPLFEQREAMAEGYAKFAEVKKDQSPELAISALRRIERIAKTDVERRKAESLRHVLEARMLAQQGIVDRGLLDKATALDPESADARDALDASARPAQRTVAHVRYLLAAGVAALSLAGGGYIAWMTWRRRRSAPGDGRFTE